jgi:hypothetical protein
MRPTIDSVVLRRFWAKVRKTSDHWIWTGAKSAGYGVLRIDGELYGAHRLMLLITKGLWSDTLDTCHKCDLPACVRPRHLWQGSRADNLADMISKGRHRSNPVRGSKNYAAKLTEKTVRAIIEDARAGASWMALARKHGVSKSTIGNILHGRRWHHVLRS